MTEKFCSCERGKCLGTRRLALGFTCHTNGLPGEFSFEEPSTAERAFAILARVRKEAAANG